MDILQKIKNSAIQQAQRLNKKIEVLKKQLEITDYKIIKCSEYQLAGLELPYDIETLHQERQAIRDQINEME